MKAKEAGGKGGGDAITQQPTSEMSGISRAWKFKTGEERMLFLITNQLQMFFKQILERAALVKSLDPAELKVEFNVEFDMTDPKTTADIVTEVWPRIQSMPTAKKMALRKLIPLLGQPTEDEEAEIEKEIEKEANKIEEEIPLDPNNKPGFGRRIGDKKDATQAN